MKFLLFFTTSIYLIISVNSQDETKNSFNFYDKLYDLIIENQNRYFQLANGTAEMEYDQSTFFDLKQNVTENLRAARCKFEKILKKFSRMCVYNKKTYDLYQSLVSGPNVQRRLHNLSDLSHAMVDYSFNQSSTVNAEITEIRATITYYCGKLVEFSSNLKHSALDKIEKLRDEISKESEVIEKLNVKVYVLIYSFDWSKNNTAVEQAKARKYKLEQKIKKINQLLKDVEEYKQWIIIVTEDLEKILIDIGQNLSNMKTILESTERLINDGKKEDTSIEYKNRVIKNLDKRVNEIYEKSCSFLQK